MPTSRRRPDTPTWTWTTSPKPSSCWLRNEPRRLPMADRVTSIAVYAERAPGDFRWGFRYIVGDVNRFQDAQLGSALEALEAGTRAVAEYGVQLATGDEVRTAAR